MSYSGGVVVPQPAPAIGPSEPSATCLR